MTMQGKKTGNAAFAKGRSDGENAYLLSRAL